MDYTKVVISAAISGIDEFDDFSILSMIKIVDFIGKQVNLFLDHF